MQQKESKINENAWLHYISLHKFWPNTIIIKYL